MKTKSQVASFFWLIPFAAFIGGYFLARTFCSSHKIPVPRLVGLPLAQGAKLASDNKLSIQIIAEKSDPDIQSGTIISQKPHAQQTAKPHQVIYVVTAKHPEQKKAPDVQGKPIEQITHNLTDTGIPYKIISLPINGASTIIIAQYPAAQQPLTEQLILYTTQYQQTFIIPDFRNKPLADVIAFLEKHLIPATVTYDHPNKTDYRIDQQRPLAGTLISLQQPPTIQLLATAYQD